MKKTLVAFVFLLCSALAAQAAVTVQENVIWYRLHLGMGIGDFAVAPVRVFSFIDKEITPAFPSGLTITQARGQWSSPEHGLIREHTTVIDVQCTDTEENWQKIQAIAVKYVELFKPAQASFFVTRVPGITTTLFY